MAVGIGLIDKIIARWSSPDGSLTGLIRFSIPCLLLCGAWIAPQVRVLSRKWQKKYPARSAAISTGIICIFVASLLWPLNRIEWSVIDDHQILLELNEHEPFTAADLLEKIRTHNELGGSLAAEDNIARFRPSYYLLRYLEVWLWQDNPHTWGRARIVIAALSLSLFFLALARLTDPLLASLVTLSVTTFPCWPDTWRYLGRAEIYAALGVGLNLYGFALLWKSASPSAPGSWKQPAGWFLMLLGLAIALGSKENFIILLGPIGLVYLRNFYFRKPIGISGHLTMLLSLALVAGIASVLKYKLALANGLDIYGRPTESSQRLSFIIPALRVYFLSSQGLVLLTMSAVSLFLGWFRSAPASQKSRWAILRDIGLSLGITAAVFVSQYVFYVGALENRYRFPAEFMWFLAAIAIAHCMTTSPRLHELRLIAWRKTAWRGLFLLAFLPCLSLGPHRLTQETQIRVDQTRRFENFLSQVAAACKLAPQRPLVIETTRVFAYEPAYAMPILLKHFGIKNPLYHRYSPGTDNTTTESPHLFHWLVDQLAKMSRDGKDGYLPWPTDDSPLSTPLIIGLDADAPVTAGEWLGRAPW